MKTKVIIIAVAFSVIMPNAFANEVTSSDLVKLLTRRIEAFSKGDTAELVNICTKDYQCINSIGHKMTMEEIKQTIITQKNQMKAYEILAFQPFVAEDESMAFAVSEVQEEIVQDKIIIKSSLIITEIYRKVKGKWKIQLTQISQKICNYP
jgi:hypothetical protein